MSERAGLIDAVLEDLEDDAPRLVFADWLEDHGEAERAEFIRLQCELAKLPAEDEARDRLTRRAQELLQAHVKDWAESLGHRVECYARGFATSIRCFPDAFADTAARLLAREPVEMELRIKSSELAPEDIEGFLDGLDTLAGNPHLRAVRAITCGHAYCSAEGGGERFVRLLRSPHLTNLKEIDIFALEIGLEGVQALVGSPAPFRLRSLLLYEALQAGEDAEETEEVVQAVAALANCDKLSELEHLDLSFNGVGPESLRALLASEVLPRTMRLEINEPAIGPDDPESGPLGRKLERRYRFAGLQ